MITTACRFVGGSLDGAVRQVPAGVTTAATTERDGTRSWYELDDSDPAGTFRFVGLNTTGETMSKLSRAFSEAARRDREAIEEAMRAKSCRSCGRVFGSTGAYMIHFEDGEGTRCLSDGARGQLQEVAGVWVLPGSDAARR